MKIHPYRIVAELHGRHHQFIALGEYHPGATDRVTLTERLPAARDGVLPRWTSDGHVMFARNRDEGGLLYEIDPDTDARQAKLVYGFGRTIEDVSCEPDGHAAAIIGYDGENMSLWREDTGSAEEITNRSDQPTSVQWHPNGHKVVYASDGITEKDAWAEGGTILTDIPASDPCYTTDGESVVCVLAGQLIAINRDNRSEHPLLYESLPDLPPGSWLADPVPTPDGSRIVFSVRSPDGHSRLAVVPAGGGAPRYVQGPEIWSLRFEPE